MDSLIRILLFSVAVVMLCIPAVCSVKFSPEFAPHEGCVPPIEKPFRSDICLNGFWQFQPAAVPQTGKKPPELPRPDDKAWDKTLIKIPSPWNVNSFSRSDGGDFLCYPSYPQSWEKADMGWLRRTFRVPEDWKDRRLILRFEAVAGDCEVLVNGTEVCRHFDSFLPFEADITSAVKWDKDNEILVGVRKPDLFNEEGKLGSYTYPTGSFWGTHIAGIWQDVYLLGIPRTGIDDVYVKPMVGKDRLEVDLIIRNTGDKPVSMTVSGKVYPWVSKAGESVVSAPEPKWQLGSKPALDLAPRSVTVHPGKESPVTLQAAVEGKLKLWSMESPNLYGLVVEMKQASEVVDRRYVRFGWREFSIEDGKFMLNGKPIQLLGDAWHFMGVPQMTRRYAWAWYKMLKDVNANAVRLHAQPYPSFYLDMADEMGIAVLDESAIWASHCSFNYDHPDIRQRFLSHVEKLVLRDRNHPSVFGWSIANEINAALGVKRASKEIESRVDDHFAVITNRVKELDPTRPWISSDGDEDMHGRLPVIVAHYGDINYYRNLAEKGKPWGVGEAGCGYYGTPKHVSAFNGPRAYESFEGRMEGVALEAYDLITEGQRPGGSYCSIFNLAWYGLKALPLGLKDISSSPTAGDGIFFSEYIEGKPGMQPERLGPYTTTFNPGYDPTLPLYEPWPLFDTVKAAYNPGKPAPCPIARPAKEESGKSKANGTIENAGFAGKPDRSLFFSLHTVGVPLNEVTGTDSYDVLFIDGDSIKEQDIERFKKTIENTLSGGGSVMLWGVSQESLSEVNKLLPYQLELSDREAISLVKRAQDPVTDSLTNADLYFAEWTAGSIIMERGLAGPMVEKGRVLLEACNTDWRRWNNKPENVKIASVLRSERETKPTAAALVEVPVEKGKFYICNIQPMIFTPQHTNLLRTIAANLGLKLRDPSPMEGGVFNAAGYLKEALVIGSFTADGYEEAVKTEFLPEASADNPKPEDRVGELAWKIRSVGEGLPFDFREMDMPGGYDNCAAYLSFWLYSPRPLDQLLAQPDVPKVDMLAGSDDGVRIWLNGKLLFEDSGVHPHVPDQYHIRTLPLKQGWNHFLVKVIQGTGDWRFSARLQASDPRFLSSLKSSLVKPEDGGLQ